MKRERATKKQQETLTFITEFISQHDYSPSYREIMGALGYKSVSTVAVHVDGLISKGYLLKRDNSVRSLEIVSAQPSELRDPAAVQESVEDTLKKAINEQTDPHKREILTQALEILGYEKQ